MASAPLWQRLRDGIGPARFAAPSAALRRAVPHRTAAVAVGASFLLGVGVIAAGYAGAGDREVSAPPTPVDAPVAVPPDLAAGTIAADPAAFGSGEFATPTRNITCRIDDREARCDVRRNTWSSGAAGCPDPGLVVGAAGARASCTEAPAPARPEKLGYGERLTRGDLTCVSRRSGVECRDGRSGHGFAAARASYRLY